jgi:APA family basic amino acid/polyamine antiporter
VLGGAVLYVVLLLTGSTDAVVSLANVAAIGAMAVINIAAFVAMRHDPTGGVHLPGGPVLPALGLVTALSQLLFISWVAVVIGVALLAAGSVLYLVRHRFHHPAAHAELQQQVEHGDTPGVRAVGGRSRLAASTSPQTGATS